MDSNSVSFNTSDQKKIPEIMKMLEKLDDVEFFVLERTLDEENKKIVNYTERINKAIKVLIKSYIMCLKLLRKVEKLSEKMKTETKNFQERIDKLKKYKGQIDGLFKRSTESIKKLENIKTQISFKTFSGEILEDVMYTRDLTQIFSMPKINDIKKRIDEIIKSKEDYLRDSQLRQTGFAGLSITTEASIVGAAATVAGIATQINYLGAKRRKNRSKKTKKTKKTKKRTKRTNKKRTKRRKR